MNLIDDTIARMISRGLNQSINDLPSLQVLRKGLNGCATLGGDDQLSRIFGIQLCLLDPIILESLAIDPRYKTGESGGCPVRTKAMGTNAALQ